jgi:hypothetical protein
LFFSARCRYNREYSCFNRFSRRFGMKRSGMNPVAVCSDRTAVRLSQTGTVSFEVRFLGQVLLQAAIVASPNSSVYASR